MNNRVVVGLVGIAAIAAYYFYSRTSPDLQDKGTGGSGVSTGGYQYSPPPPAPTGNTTNTYNYNIAFPEVPPPNVTNVPPSDLSATSQGGGGGPAPKGNVPPKYDVPAWDAAFAAAADPYKGVFKPATTLPAGIANAPAAQPVVGGYMGGPSAHMVDGNLYAPGLKDSQTVQKPSIWRSPFQGG